MKVTPGYLSVISLPLDAHLNSALFDLKRILQSLAAIPPLVVKSYSILCQMPRKYHTLLGGRELHLQSRLVR